MLKYTSYPSTTILPLFICMQTVVWQSPFYGTQYLFLGKRKKPFIVYLSGALERLGGIHSFGKLVDSFESTF